MLIVIGVLAAIIGVALFCRMYQQYRAERGAQGRFFRQLRGLAGGNDEDDEEEMRREQLAEEVAISASHVHPPPPLYPATRTF